MNILVPTDFSECANKAFESAMALAKKHDGNLHVFHASNIPDDWLLKLSTQEFGNRLNKSIKSYATSQMNALCNKAELSGLSCEMHFDDGRLINHLDHVNQLEEVSKLLMIRKLQIQLEEREQK